MLAAQLVAEKRPTHLVLFNIHFSGLGGAVGPVCVSVCMSEQ